VARIAGALHLATGRPVQGPGAVVRPETVAAAVRLGKYLEAHALAAYDVMRADPRLRLARAILRWAGRTGADRLTERDALTHAAPHGADRTAAAVHEACGVLVEHGWLRPLGSPRRGPGRPPSPAYAVHPAALESEVEV
jgi:hypothetical protein